MKKLIIDLRFDEAMDIYTMDYKTGNYGITIISNKRCFEWKVVMIPNSKTMKLFDTCTGNTILTLDFNIGEFAYYVTTDTPISIGKMRKNTNAIIVAPMIALPLPQTDNTHKILLTYTLQTSVNTYRYYHNAGITQYMIESSKPFAIRDIEFNNNQYTINVIDNRGIRYTIINTATSTSMYRNDYM